MRKLLVIGVDGADLEYVSGRFERGALPTMAALAREGSFGPLHSTCPPVSCPAWPTMTTGLNPGSLGVFDLTVPTGYGKRIVSALDIRAPRLWDYVGANGGRCVVFNVPVTYPPREINGILVSGFLSPENAPFSYPAEVGEELAARFGYSPRHESSKRRQIEKVRRRTAAFIHLLKQQPWDFAMVVFSATDWAQHDHWEDRAYIDRLFAEVDSAIGEIASVADAENIAVISDHGFTGARRILNVNKVLAQIGFLTYGATSSGEAYAPNVGLAGAARKRNPVAAVLRKVLRPRAMLALLHRTRMERLLDCVPGPLWHWLKARLPVWSTPIDWERTRAYLYNGLPQTINVNLAGRETSGIVQAEQYEAVRAEVAEALLGCVDPLDGAPIFSRVLQREEAFPGRMMERAPDLSFEVTGDRYLVSPADHPQAVWQTGRERGRHRKTGIYVLRGPAFSEQTGAMAHLVDMTPTCLHSMGCPVPSGVDGRVAAELLDRGADGVETLRYDIEVTEMAPEEQDMSDVKRHLQDLGYM